MHRTYVRRRLVAVASAMLLPVMLAGPIARAVGITGDPAVLVASRTYVVRRGDTLWSIASSVAPTRDPRRVIGELDRLNRGPIDSLEPGQVLLIPSYA